MTYKFLYLSIDVLLSFSAVWSFIMSNVVDVVLAKERNSDDPRARTDDFIHPFAMLQDLASLKFVIHDLSLLFDSLLIATNSDYQVDMREQFFGLL